MNTEEKISEEMNQHKFEKVVNIYRSFQDVVPNILDSIYLDENAHTRFLSQLLNFRRNGSLVFLESFLTKLFLSNECFRDNDNISRSKVTIENQRENIDCLIKGDNYVIIIENKIRGAHDQTNQLSKYVDSQKSEKISLEEIFVVYLTLAGGDPAKHSLPEKERVKLGDRFIKITYQDEILRWLEEDVLPGCLLKEDVFIDSVRLYIDYLKGMLGEKPWQKSMVDRLLSALNYVGNSESYVSIQALMEYNAGDGKDESMKLKVADFHKAIQILLREIEKTNPFLNPDHVANVLKWMFKNNPPPPYKMNWIDGAANVAPYSPGIFMCSGVRHIKLKHKDKDVEIHMCCSLEGIKRGPYFFNEHADTRFGESYIRDKGLVDNGNGKHYRLPLDSFDTSESKIFDVALHLQKLVRILEDAPK